MGLAFAHLKGIVLRQGFNSHDKRKISFFRRKSGGMLRTYSLLH
jgi:hypothetical protein